MFLCLWLTPPNWWRVDGSVEWIDVNNKLWLFKFWCISIQIMASHLKKVSQNVRPSESNTNVFYDHVETRLIAGKLSSLDRLLFRVSRTHIWNVLLSVIQSCYCKHLFSGLPLPVSTILSGLRRWFKLSRNIEESSNYQTLYDPLVDTTLSVYIETVYSYRTTAILNLWLYSC